MIVIKKFNLYSIFCFTLLIPLIISQKHGLPSTKLHVTPEQSGTFQIINFDDISENEDSPHHVRSKRETTTQRNITTKVYNLIDSHLQLMVNWAGEGSDVIICLARNPTPYAQDGVSIEESSPSAVFVSYDYGDSYENRTEKFASASLDKFFNHQKFNTYTVFIDSINKQLFTSSNDVNNVTRTKLLFTPSDVLLHPEDPHTFLVYDKVDPKKKLWVTRDFGQGFTLVQEAVKSYAWSPSNNNLDEETKIKNEKKGLVLYVERMEPYGTNTILASRTFFQDDLIEIVARKVLDFQVKGDFLFIVKEAKNKTGDLDLWVSYKKAAFVRARFDINLPRLEYHIADVTDKRVFLSVRHSEQLSNLYVSETIDYFHLSLERIFCFFPNTSYREIFSKSPDAFTDLHKVEGMNGIYIATHIVSLPESNILPEHLVSLITYDRGGEWHYLQPPTKDDSGQPIDCDKSKNCSLHLTQKFTQLYRMPNFKPILSSKSAPGLIMANGVLGKSVKGHPGLFLSTNAGLTWRHVIKSYYVFNFGDHGGVLVAVMFASTGKTREILYSTDYGENWKSWNFSTEHLHIFGLMTEPGENTTIFTLFGSIKARHEWLIIKVDLKNAFDRACIKTDYKQWSPTADNGPRMPCILGRKDTFVRRLENRNCYDNRSLIDQPIRTEKCQCEEEDFECDFGFMKDAAFKKRCILNQTILGYDPHLIPNTCVAGQTYNRTKGYRKIVGDECVAGNEDLYLPDIIPCPIKEMNAFLIVALREKIARLDLESTQEMETLPIFNLKNIIAIEFDLKTNCVYWADIINDTIGRQCLDGKKEPEILVEANLYSIEGMALDWMSNHLYFVDGMRANIQMISTDSQHDGRLRKTILDSDHLKKPRGIALHPRKGLMFWTDWAPNHASVSSAYLDGSGIKQLFKSPDVAWPNGITIDYMAERIYWADAREDYIASANLDGSNMIKIVSHHSSVAHPFSVAIFKENLIWDDWKEDSIFITNKNNAHAILRLIKDQEGLMDLKVYSHTVQKGTNACSKKPCSHICVGKGGSDYACLCPDGMVKVGENTCLCPGKIKPFNNGTCPSVAHTCSPQQFSCASNNYSCLPITWKCDGEEDCSDGSDEEGCLKTTCPPTKFRCENNNKCIPAYWHCDIDLDCSDGSDEWGCSYICNNEQFQCTNGRCISKLWLCDHEDDCRDGSDEQNCTKNFTRTCRVGEFSCLNNNQCIPNSWQCDGEQDCSDGSDETEKCTNNHCEDWQFKCDNNQCTFKSWVCDGDHDCRDGSDEKNCTDHKDSLLPTPHSIIPNETECTDVMFHCNNNECIPFWWKCDKVDDCGDNSDEMGCGPTDEETFTPTKPTNITISCGPEKFQCADGKCIPQKFVCDNITDCDDKADEKHCDHIIRCDTNQFKCNDGSCLPLQKVCDGVNDCEDGYDEALCDGGITSPPGPTCNPGMFVCDTLRCFPLTFKCDGHQDCYDGTDEDNCGPNTTRVYQVLHLGVEPRSINSSNLVLYWLVPNPKGIDLEFLPSIAEQGHSWQNASNWTTGMNHRFTGLHAFTSYNLTVYVRIKGTDTVSIPSKYLLAMTGEGVPSVPWNVTAKQISANKVQLKWNRPIQPQGVITSYNIFMTPPIPPISITTRSNVDNYTFEYNFLLNVNYSFWVIALNSEHRSNTSNVVTLKPDETAVIGIVKEFKAKADGRSMNLDWAPVANVTGYYIQVHEPFSYPTKPYILTNSTSNHFVLNNLAPGAEYKIEIRGLRNDYHGPSSFVKASLPGEQLPRINDLKAVLLADEGTSVNLSWGIPRDKRKIEWKYAVYFAYRTSGFSVPYLETSDLNATIEHLHSCESYLFTVGIAGPLGYGPLGNIKNVVTRFNLLAPPKNIQISSDKHNDTIMHISWFPSCQMNVDKVSYVINVRELNLGLNSSTTLKPRPFTGKYTHWYEIQYGGHYGVSISTNAPGANKSEEVIWAAPPLPVPEEVQLLSEINGSLFVYWKDMKLEINKKFTYVVVITEGSVLNASNSQEFITNAPPFIFNDVKPDMTYSVAVCLRTEDGYRSALSGAEFHRIDKANWLSGITTSSLVSVAVPIILVVIALAAALGFFVIRHRRLQHNFASFANSHYDTRSGAATFGAGDGLEEEDSPVIRGFSDDEPLVIA